jgi:hypothetical protein
MRIQTLALLLLAVPAAAQQPRQLTNEDYARAERRLAAFTTPLVSGMAGPPTWTADGRFWYRATTPRGAAFWLVDPARGTRDSVFDPARLTPALGAAAGREIPASQLPIQALDLTADGRRATVTTPGGATTVTCRRTPARAPPPRPMTPSCRRTGGWRPSSAATTCG